MGGNAFQFNYIGATGTFTATVVVAPLGTTNTWDGGDADDLLWSSADNWSSNDLPLAGQILIFGGAATADVLTKNDLGGNFGRINFTGTVGGFTISPQDLALQDLMLSHGIQASHSGATCSVNNDLLLLANQTFSVTGSANLTLGGGPSTNLNGFDLTTHCAPSSGTPQLNLDHGLFGAGNLLKTGPGRVSMGGVGTSSNAYTGTTTVQEGELRMVRGTITAPANCIPNALIIGGGANPASVTSTQAEKIADAASVTVNANGSFLPGAAETIGALTINGGLVNAGANTLQVNGTLTANTTATINAGKLRFSGTPLISVATGVELSVNPELESTAALTKTGAGLLRLWGVVDQPGLTISAGTVEMNGDSTQSGGFTLQSAGTLTGEGTLESVNAAAGGVIAPTPGESLSMNTFTGGATATYRPTLDGALANLIDVSTLNLGTMKLDPIITEVVPAGAVRIIVLKSGSVVTATRFTTVGGATLNENSLLTTAFNTFRISYAGGTGNDITLTSVVPPVTGTNRVWDGGALNDNWLTPANWVGDVAPAPGDDLEFPAAHVTSINNFPAGVTFGSISFTGVPGSIDHRSISGSALQLLGNLSSSLDDSSTRQVNISTPITLLSAATITNSGQRQLRILAAVTTTASPLRILGNSTGAEKRVVFSGTGVISGPARLIVDLHASVELISGNTYGGGTEVRSGHLSALNASEIYTNGLTVGDGVRTAVVFTGNAAAFISATITVHSGTLQAGTINCTSLVLDGTLTRPATVTAQGVTLTTGLTTDTGDIVTMSTLTAPSLTQNGGALNFTGAVAIAGTARLQSGDLTLRGGSSVGQLQVDAGTLTQVGFLSVANLVTILGGSFSAAGAGDGLGFTGGGTRTFTVATTANLHTLGDAAFDDLIDKRGAGTLTVTGALRATLVTVSGGFLHSDAVNGNLVSGPATGISLKSGHLRGTGVFGDLTATPTAGSQVSPGASPGRLTTSGILVGAGQAMQFNFEINSVVPATGHDQILVTGSSPEVTLAPGHNATVLVTIAPGFVATVGTELVLISNEGANPISGTFAGKPQDFEEALGFNLFRYSYTGGDGNDFTITRISPPPAGEFRVWDGGGPDANWTTDLNWVGNAAPNPGDALHFPGGAAQTTNTNDYPAGTPFSGFKIEANYILNGARVLLKGDVDVQSPGTTTLALPLRLTESRAVILSGGGSLVRSGVTQLGASAALTLRHNGSGEINVTGRMERLLPLTDGGVILDGTGSGLVKYNVAGDNLYVGETWVQRGVLELTGAFNSLVPGSLRIGGAGFTASVENPGTGVDGRINNASDLIIETGGTHVMTGSGTVERINRLFMRGGSLVKPSDCQFVVLESIHAQGNVASTITTPLFFESSSAGETDHLSVESGSSLTLTGSIQSLFSGTIDHSKVLQKTGTGPLILQAAMTAGQVVCLAGTFVLSTGSQITGRAVLSGGTLAGNGSPNEIGGTANGGTLAPSGPSGSGPAIMNTGNVFLAEQSHLAIEIGGTGSDQIDRINLNGVLDLNRCILDLSLINGFIPTVGQTFNIIGSANPAQRPFAGKDEGTTFSAAGQLWSITYLGGGHDVVLTAQGPAPTLDFTSFVFGPPSGGGSGVQVTASITGPASTLVNLEASTDLVIWTVIGSATTTSLGVASFNITDSAAGGRRFYKVGIP